MVGIKGPKLDLSCDPPPGVSHAVVGCAFLVSSCLSSFVAAYLAVQGSVDKYIDSNKEVRILELKVRGEENDKTDMELRTLRTELSELRNKMLRGTDKNKGKGDIREKDREAKNEIQPP